MQRQRSLWKMAAASKRWGECIPTIWGRARSVVHWPASWQDIPIASVLWGEYISAIGGRAQMFMLAMFSVGEMPTLQDQVNVLALIMMSRYIANTLTSVPGGRCADRLPRWIIIAIGSLMLGAVAMGIFFLVQARALDPLNTTEKLWVIVGVNFGSCAIGGFIAPAAQAYFQDLSGERVEKNPRFRNYVVERTDFTEISTEQERQQAILERAHKAAVYWLSSYSLTGELIGSLAGGAVLNRGMYEQAFLLNAISFLFPVIAVVGMQVKGVGPVVLREPRQRRDQRPNWREEWKFRVLREELRKDSEAMMACCAVFVLWGLMTNGDLTMPLIASEVFHDPKVYNTFNAANIVGWIVASVLFAIVNSRKKKKKERVQGIRRWIEVHRYQLALILFACCSMTYAMGINLRLSIVMMVLLAVPARYINIEASRLIVRNASQEIRGRLNGQRNRVEVITKFLGMGLAWAVTSQHLWLVSPGFGVITLVTGFILLRLPHRKRSAVYEDDDPPKQESVLSK